MKQLHGPGVRYLDRLESQSTLVSYDEPSIPIDDANMSFVSNSIAAVSSSYTITHSDIRYHVVDERKGGIQQ